MLQRRGEKVRPPADPPARPTDRPARPTDRLNNLWFTTSPNRIDENSNFHLTCQLRANPDPIKIIHLPTTSSCRRACPGPSWAAAQPALRDALDLTEESRVVVVLCEGATEPEKYKELVGASPEDVAGGDF